MHFFRAPFWVTVGLLMLGAAMTRRLTAAFGGDACTMHEEFWVRGAGGRG